MDENELFVSEQGNVQVNPDKALEANLSFIDRYHNIVGENNQSIQEQTHAQGTDVPAHLGGLNAGGDYWTSRYQTPNVEAATKALESATRLQALNTAQSNYLDDLKQQYNQAYRSYNKRKNKTTTTTTSDTTLPQNPANPAGDVETTTSPAFRVVEDAFTKAWRQELYNQQLLQKQQAQKEAIKNNAANALDTTNVGNVSTNVPFNTSLTVGIRK